MSVIALRFQAVPGATDTCVCRGISGMPFLRRLAGLCTFTLELLKTDDGYCLKQIAWAVLNDAVMTLFRSNDDTSSFMEKRSVVPWFDTSQNQTLGWRLLLRVVADTDGLHISVFPTVCNARHVVRNGRYYNDPYKLASWTCQMPSPHFTASPLSTNVLLKEDPQHSKLFSRPLAVRVLLANLGGFVVCRTSRAIHPTPQIGDCVLVENAEGRFSYGQCMHVSRWSTRRAHRTATFTCYRVVRCIPSAVRD